VGRTRSRCPARCDCIASLAATESVGGSGPAGYPEATYLASVYDAAGGVRPFSKAGRQYDFLSQLLVHDSGSISAPANVWTPFSLVAGVPATVSSVNLTVWHDDDTTVTASPRVVFRKGGTSGAGHVRLATQHSADACEQQAKSWSEIAPASDTLEWSVASAVTNWQLEVYVNGYEE